MFEFITKDSISDGNISILKIKDIKTDIDFSEFNNFILLLVDNIENCKAEEISNFLEKMLISGMIYLNTWGKNCEMIHDITDEILSDPKNENKYENSKNGKALIMTDWYSNESLEDALWSAIYCSHPSDNYWDETSDILILTINDNDCYVKIKNYLNDLENFNKMVCG